MALCGAAALAMCAYAAGVNAQVTPTPEVEPDKVKAEDSPPPDETLGIEALFGYTGRVGSISSGNDSAERSGTQVGLGLFYSPSRIFAIGLLYQYSRFGHETYNPSGNDSTGDIRRALHTPMLNARIYPIRSDNLGMYIGLGLGMDLQTASASGTYVTNNPYVPAQSFTATAGPKLGFALGAAIGVDYDVSRNIGLLASFGFTHHAMSSDAMSDGPDPFIAGMGSVNQLDLRVAFQYRFDLSDTTIPVSASVETASR